MSSDLKVTNIKHESSGSNNLVLASDGNVSITNEISSGTFNGTIGSSATFVSALFNKGNNGYVILPSGIEIKWGNTSIISSFAGSDDYTHTYTSDQGSAFGTATLWGIVWAGDRTATPVATGGVSGGISVDNSASSIKFYANNNAGSDNTSGVRYLFLAIGH